MCLFGKRTPYMFDYQIGFDANRKILGVKSDIYCDGGWTFNGDDSFLAQLFGQSCYNIPALSFSPYAVKTTTHSNTAVRAPGMVNAHAMIEHMLEHSAAEMGMNPLDLMMANLMQEGSPLIPPPNVLDVPCPITEMVEKIKQTGNYEARKQEMDLFNQSNKWKKRGMSLVPMRFGHVMKGFGIRYSCMISVFAGDGTISVTTSGIEMGQGLNTKVHQVIASELGVDMSLIKIKSALNIASPNATVTGGSFGSELNCAAAIEACKILNERLQPIKDELGPTASWMEIVGKAFELVIDLCARYQFSPDLTEAIKEYSIWGAVLTEVDVDILTGEKHIRRCDLIEDVGLSTSPLVDIGQIEGAFMMGVGLWTSEEIKFHPNTGELLTKNTWEYKPPAAKDIPQDFRVTMMKNQRNQYGVLGSKATGEPALLLSVSVLFAIRDALNESRMQNDLPKGWWKFDAPATVEKIHQHSGIKPSNFTF